MDGADPGDPRAGADYEGAPVRLGRQALGRGQHGDHLWRDHAEFVALYRLGIRGAGVCGGVRLVRPVGARPWPTARAADGQYYLGRTAPGSILQRLVVVAGRASSSTSADS